MARAGLAKEHLKSFIQRIERLEEEKSALVSDIREVYREAKGTGFDVKIMRMVIRLRKLDTADRQEQDALLDLYLTALGMGRDDIAPEIHERAERFIADNTPAEQVGA